MYLPHRTRQMFLHKKEMALVHLMWFKLLHIFSHKNHNYNQPHLHVKLVRREFVGPLCSLTTTDQTRNMVLKQKSFLCSSFNPFYALKCVLGAGENELESVQCPAILREAITEDPQRQSKKLKQTERSVLCEIIVSPLDPFYFYCFCCYFACFPSPRLCLPLLSSLSFYSLYRFSVYFSHLLSHFLPPSLILIWSQISYLFWFISDKLAKWYGVQKMENTF